MDSGGWGDGAAGFSAPTEVGGGTPVISGLGSREEGVLGLADRPASLPNLVSELLS